MPISPHTRMEQERVRNDMPVLTVAVKNDGEFLHLKDCPPARLKKCVPQTTEGIHDRWRKVIRQMLKHSRPCKVRLIVGFNKDEPVVEEMTFRPRVK